MKLTVQSVLVLAFLVVSSYATTDRTYLKLECCTIRGTGVVNKIFIPPAIGVEIRDRYTLALEDELEGGEEEEEPVLTLFKVSYDSNVPEEAKIAINYALLLWQALIDSEVPIEVRVVWSTDAEEGTLASARAAFHDRNAGDNVLPAHYDPVVLINRKARHDHVPGFNDIDINVNATAPLYYGIDGDCPVDQYDMVTIILHEVGHGLGFVSSANKIDSDNTASGQTEGRLGFSDGLGLVFDYFIEDYAGLDLIDPNNFQNPSNELFQLFTGAKLFFGGPLAKMANHGNHVPLAAPRLWDEGTSISHLNEGSFSGTNPNALMTPWIGLGEAVHDPGPVTMGIFGDIGWDYLWITQAKRKDSEDLVSPFRFSAKIDNDSPLQRTPHLFYKRPTEIEYTEVAMYFDPETGLYSTDLTLDGTQTQFDYYIEVIAKGNRLFSYPDTRSEAPLHVTLGPDLIAPTLSHTPQPFLFANSTGLTLQFQADDNSELGLVETEVWLDGAPVNTYSYEAQGETAFATTLILNNLTGYQNLEYRFSATDRSMARNKTSLPLEGVFSLRIEPAYDPVTSYSTGFDTGTADFILNGFTVSSVDGFQSPILGTPHPYYYNGNRVDHYAYLRQQILVQAGSQLSFDEVVLVEPGEDGSMFGETAFFDYVAVEASLDQGVTWFTLAPGWDSTDRPVWENAYNQEVPANGVSSAIGDSSMLRARSISIDGNPAINPGDVILLRFHLYSDANAVGWGWAIDNLVIQPGENQMNPI